MPSDDPFLFSSASPLDARASLILRGYPLSQLLFFGAYTLAGESALVVLKGVLMTLFYRPVVESISLQRAASHNGFGYRWGVAASVLPLR